MDARSVGRSDLNTMGSPADQNFAFSNYAALRVPRQARTYLVAWHEGRVTNGFEGYHVYQIDRAAASLRLVDKWNDEGAKVYNAFKHFKDPRGIALFDPLIEFRELRDLCEHAANPNRGLATACSQFKR
jgi:quinol monooxygenase YgiN